MTGARKGKEVHVTNTKSCFGQPNTEPELPRRRPGWGQGHSQNIYVSQPLPLHSMQRRNGGKEVEHLYGRHHADHLCGHGVPPKAPTNSANRGVVIGGAHVGTVDGVPGDHVRAA